MESLVSYGSDEENDHDHTHYHYPEAKRPGQASRRADDTNYDDVNMDMSEDSNNNESSSSTSSGEKQDRSSRSSEASFRSRNLGQYRKERKSAEHDQKHHDRSSSRRDRDRELNPSRSERHTTESSRYRHSPERRRDRHSPERKRDRHSPEKRRDRLSSEKRSDRQSSEHRPDRRSSERRPEPRASERRCGRRSSESKPERQSTERHRDRLSSEKGLGGSDRKHSSETESSRHKEGRTEKTDNESPTKVPALMDLKPFGGEPPPPVGGLGQSNSRDRHDKIASGDRDHRDRSEGKDAYRHREDRLRRDKERHSERDRLRDTDKYSSRDRDGNRDRHSDKRSSRDNYSRKNDERNTRSDDRKFTPKPHSTSRASPPPSSDYRHSYKVNKKLQVMEKMGLQIKTPDGSMATVQQLVQRNLPTAAGALPGLPGLPTYYNPNAVNAAKIVEQVQKRKLLWGHKEKPEVPPAAKWTGTKFAQDTDGKQASKFMRLMGIKDPVGVQAPPVATAASEPLPSQDTEADVLRKQEEMFQNMQAQYEVARVTTHTMRGVGLGFSQQIPRQF